jgi:DNA end-binding protein Ku
MALTNTLISATRIKEFDFAKYKDTYVEKLQKLIQLKIDGREVVAAPDHEEPRILNLMDALKKSVAEAQARSAGIEAPADAAPAAGPPAGPPVGPVAEGEKKMAPSAGRKKRKAEGG